MNPQEAARRAAALKFLADVVRAEDGPARAAAREALAELGIKTLTAKLADGTEIADVTLRAGSTYARVTDPEKFMDWVCEHRPREIVSPPRQSSVRSSYRDAVLADAKRDGFAYDPETGEVIPGITVSEGDPTLSVKLRPGCGPALMEAIRGGIVEPFALPAGES